MIFVGRKTFYVTLLTGVFACSSPNAPATQIPTLLVTNPLCDTGECRTLQIRAFAWNFTVPQPFRGFITVGEVHSPTACLTFPASWDLTVTAVDSTGAPKDTTIYTWTPDDALYVTVADGNAPLDPIGATETFTPADAPGWNLTFSDEDSGGMPLTGQIRAAEACDPT